MLWLEPQSSGIPKGNDPESIYAVMSGTHFNGGCCFDYGNSETNDKDDGCGAMEAIYFGSAHWHKNTGAGDTGPWVGADLEQGMYYGGGNVSQNNTQTQPLPTRRDSYRTVAPMVCWHAVDRHPSMTVYTELYSSERL